MGNRGKGLSKGKGGKKGKSGKGKKGGGGASKWGDENAGREEEGQPVKKKRRVTQVTNRVANAWKSRTDTSRSYRSRIVQRYAMLLPALELVHRTMV